MEITCRIVYLSEEFIRIQTISKKQEIDIFFTAAKKEAIHSLFEPHMVATFSIEIQTVDVGNFKHAKLWFLNVLFPPLPDCSDFSSVQMARYHLIRTLYEIK